MRFLCAILLLAFAAAVAVFATQNQQPVTIKFLDRQESFSLSALVGVVYLIGMVTGWTIVGLLRRTAYRATEWR